MVKRKEDIKPKTFADFVGLATGSRGSFENPLENFSELPILGPNDRCDSLYIVLNGPAGAKVARAEWNGFNWAFYDPNVPPMDDVERIRQTLRRYGEAFEPADMVNHPPHYSRGPEIALAECGSNGMVINWLRDTFERAGKKWMVVECIEVIRWIPDVRLATAVKYIWRVGFGGKHNDRENIEKAIWYLNDWLENSIDE